MAEQPEPYAVSLWRSYVQVAIDMGLWTPPDGMTSMASCSGRSSCRSARSSTR